MKNFSRFFAVLAALIVSVLGVSAGSAQQSDGLAEQMVTQIANTMNTPQTKMNMMKGAQLSAFKAIANGNVLILDMTTNNESLNLGALSATAQEQMASMFANLFKSGMLQEENGEDVIAMFNALGVKYRINFKDLHGGAITTGDIDF